MKRLVVLSCSLVALVWAARSASAGGPACGPACAAPPAPCTVLQPVVQDKVSYHVDITYDKCKKPGELAWIAKVKEGEIAVPCTKKVPVCTKDPCTGCTHTEFVEETVMKKVPTKSIDICPDKCGEEEKVKKCVKIIVNHTPVTVMQEVPAPGAAPACSSGSCCHR
jgi:hypothetical protein